MFCLLIAKDTQSANLVSDTVAIALGELVKISKHLRYFFAFYRHTLLDARAAHDLIDANTECLGDATTNFKAGLALSIQNSID